MPPLLNAEENAQFRPQSVTRGANEHASVTDSQPERRAQPATEPACADEALRWQADEDSFCVT
jgi:hypothetical protein